MTWRSAIIGGEMPSAFAAVEIEARMTGAR
jgi:hypothetical protein